MKWNKIEEKKPNACMKGDWDGTLVCTRYGIFHIVFMHEGVLDGVYFCDFYDDMEQKIRNVEFCAEIDCPV